MQPVIANPTFNAILQILISLGMIASILSPFVGNGKLFTVLHYLSAAGFDIVKMVKGPTNLPESTPTLSDDAVPAVTRDVK